MSDFILVLLTGLLGLFSGFLPTYFLLYKPAKKTQNNKEDKNKGNEQNKVNYSLEPCDYIEHIKKSKNSIFFSSVGGSVLTDYSVQNALANINPEVEINIVTGDHNDNITNNFNGLTEVTKEYTLSINELVKTGINRIKEKRSVVYKSISFFNPISYFAIDYKDNSSSSFIQAKHYLISENKKSINVFYCSVRPGSDLYDCYCKQIILLEKISELRNDYANK